MPPNLQEACVANRRIHLRLPAILFGDMAICVVLRIRMLLVESSDVLRMFRSRLIVHLLLRPPVEYHCHLVECARPLLLYLLLHPDWRDWVPDSGINHVRIMFIRLSMGYPVFVVLRRCRSPLLIRKIEIILFYNKNKNQIKYNKFYYYSDKNKSI